MEERTQKSQPCWQHCHMTRQGDGLTFALRGGPSICKELGHEQVQVTVGFCMVGVLGEAVQHSPKHIIQRGSCLVQDDTGLGQESV